MRRQQAVLYRHHNPSVITAEADPVAAELLAHPDLLGLARQIIGPDVCFDHCSSARRSVAHNDNGIGWHTHYYEPDTETNRFIRIFLYVTGFKAGDSNLLAIPGSHLLDVDELSRVMVPLSHSFESITEEAAAALAAVPHPATGEPMGVERLACPPGSAVVMETKAAHAVEPKPEGSNSVREPPRSRCHLGCILLKTIASRCTISWRTGWSFTTGWKNAEHSSHRGSMTPAFAQRNLGEGGRPPTSPRDAVPDGYGTATGYTNVGTQLGRQASANPESTRSSKL